MKDQYTFSGATTFTINGTTAPSIKISRGGSENITGAVRPFGAKEPIPFHVQSCNPTDCTIVFDGMIDFAKKYRLSKLDDPTNALASEADRDKYGVMAYDLDVVFKDGSRKRIQITATGI